MSIIVKTDLFSVSKYGGGYCTTKYNGKKHKVFFKLISDDFSLAECIKFAKANPRSVAMIDYQGLPTNQEFMSLTEDIGVYVGRSFDLGNNISADDLRDILEDLPSGVVPVVHLPEDFQDMKKLYDLSKIFPKVRYCGGKLFAIDGVNIGAIGSDIILPMDAKYSNDEFFMDNTESILEEVDIDTVELNYTNKPERQKSSGTTSSSSKTQKAPVKKVSMFSSIFQNNEGVPL